MLALELTFPAGRYHANPWFTNVTEARVAWPPEPVRILRALIATWHRKADQQAYPRITLEALIEKLATQSPSYRLPTAVSFHTRHYMPTLEGNSVKSKLVFDGFAHVADEQSLVVGWPGVELADDESTLLDHLAQAIGYFGRAESWVEAKQINCDADALNCFPESEAITNDGEWREAVSLLSTQSPPDYLTWRATFLEAGMPQGLKAAGKLAFQRALPEKFTDALSLDSDVVQSAGFRLPPATRWETYYRPGAAFSPDYHQPRIRRAGKQRPTTARFALLGRLFPRIEDAIQIGEQMRFALMGQGKVLLGEEALPAVFHGHGDNGLHQHAFFLPDPDSEGFVRHIVVHAQAGFDDDAQAVLRSLSYLSTNKGERKQVRLEAIGKVETMADQVSLLAASQEWQSVTPYLMPWFRKKRFDVPQQIAKEWRKRHPDRGIEVEVISTDNSVNMRGSRLPVTRFRRWRKSSSARPDSVGQSVRLRFSEPVHGPLAFGYSCHFGLGLFQPVVTNDPNKLDHN